MFENIADDPLEIVLEIPSGAGMDAAVRIWQMAEWIYKEFVDDAKRLKGNGPYSPANDFTAWNEFAQRSTSRTISYINHVTSLEKILLKCLEQIECVLQLPEDLIDYINSERSKRTAEMIKEKDCRDKAAAHTSFSDPKKDDSEADLRASLAFWGGSTGFFGGDPIFFEIGGMLPKISGKTAKKSKYSYCLYEAHKRMVKHFQAWDMMFNHILDELNKGGRHFEMRLNLNGSKK